MSNSQVCHTFEAALEMAIEMENESFRHYLRGILIVRDKAARDILKEMALDELEHKYELEKALVEGSMGGEHQLNRPVPTMNLDYVLSKKDLAPDSGVREALAYAIHLEKNALDFYQRMAQGCAGAPMAELFRRIGNDESRHLQKLEDLYEAHFLSEN
ncbi:rubrerythrin [Geothermobacter ehrlichii]|uniref:Rubrerythrin n=1 Tax=Geothermobacter ehrlichii TaxID=213224 RepID=A0A5D3WML6_9BACT|nr:ferritin family protein [Geothermobacter ehrlichii]TYP00243.1 rubrerythrin [Geothermobacter ehrlichii]